MKNIVWREKAKIYWCRNCNTPLITPKCELCSEIGRSIRATPPMDVRPAFEEDIKKMKETIFNEFKDQKAVKTLIPEGKITLLNKIPHIDQADEVIIDGRIIGQIYFDPRSWKWRFKPVEEGATRLIIDSTGYWCIVKRSKVGKWDRVDRSEIVNGELPDENGRIIIIGNQEGKSIGVGEYCKEFIKVIKSWEPQSPHILKGKSNIYKAIEANLRAMENLERRAIAFIDKVYEKYRNPLCISFSGGKDSLATLQLLLNTGLNGKMLFNDTGLELPETVRYIEEISEELQIELIKAEAGRIFWEAFENLGPPARDYRWCCKTCKLIPILKTMKKEYPNGSLTLVGQRKFESLSRAKSQSIWKNKWLPDSINVSPIMDWSALHIWFYIFWRKIKPNPLYQIGFDRLGCWLCPSCELAEFKLVEKIHPEIWNEWKNKLLNWALKKGYDEKWVEMGFWRWIKLPGDQMRIAREMNIKIEHGKDIKRIPTRIIKISGFSPCQGKYSIELKLDVDLDLENLKSILTVIGSVKYSKKLNVITLNVDDVKSVINSRGQITILAKNEIESEEYLKNILKAILRGMYCVRCESCKYICSTKSITIHKYPIIDNLKCSKCGKCQVNCPLTEYIPKIMFMEVKD
ncbi:MAG: phosphoadenosine phosphosulfate reductase family protein [Candidatus Methanomethylicia archaeon]|nr:phosphoadenosine phosphosulfate reductase family protein [Candidatus Methanomethylicia archaeon]MDW7988501.1 phosphoadenosine phosphosulfate reductase family protein [Nitrososphaerota archaeon]